MRSLSGEQPGLLRPILPSTVVTKMFDAGFDDAEVMADVI
jgi:hypothetical protein